MWDNNMFAGKVIFDISHASQEKLSFSKNIPKVPRNPNHKIGPKSLNYLVCKLMWNELVNKQIIPQAIRQNKS